MPGLWALVAVWAKGMPVVLRGYADTTNQKTVIARGGIADRWALS